jgi:hypothetical protein
MKYPSITVPLFTPMRTDRMSFSVYKYRHLLS